MKKFLVGVIFLIPIVVVIALSATGAMITLTSPPNPTEIVIKNNENVNVDDLRKDNEAKGEHYDLKLDSKNFEEFIVIDVLPSITPDKSIEVEIDENAGDGRVKLERIGETNRYYVIPENVGICRLEIRAKANYSIVKTLTIYVTSDSIETIEIYDENGAFVEQNVDLLTGGRYYVDINPIEALRNNDVQWSSSNTNVAKISANGELKIIGKGLTRIEAKAVDKDGNTVSDYFDIDTDKAIVTSKTIYTTQDNVTNDYLKSNYALDEDVEVSFVEDNKYAFSINEDVIVVEVIKVAEGEMGFIDLASTMYTRNGGYFPLVGNLATGEVYEGVEISFSNPEVLELEPVTGMLIPLKAGNVMVTATYNGSYVQKEVIVRENPVAFELELGSADERLGIQLTRTWGRYWLDADGNRIGTFEFGLTNKENKFDVVWSASDPTLVNITRKENSQDVILEFPEASKGQSVTVTATLKTNALLQQRVKRSFTFNLRERDAINVYTWDQFNRVSELNHNDIVLQADLYPTYTSGIRSDIYGNGFKIDASNFPVVDPGNFRNWVISADRFGKGHWEYQETGTGKIVVEDVIAIGSTLYKDVSNILTFINFYWYYCPIEIRYCQLSGFSEGVSLRNALEVTIEGCIFGENENSGINIQHEPNRAEVAKFTFKNNIFKQQGGAAIQLVTSYFGESVMDKTIKAEFNIEGFFDVYNWKKREDFKTIFANVVVSLVGTDIIPAGIIRDTFVDGVADVIDSFIHNDEYDRLFYEYGGEEYASFSFVAIGLIAKVDSESINVNTTSPMCVYDIPLEDEQGNPKGTLSDLMPLLNTIVRPSKPLHITNASYLACTDFVDYEPEIKPGDPVPNSKELYAKLVGAMDNN